MEEKKPIISEEMMTKIRHLLPIFIFAFVILMFCLSMIGNFYEIAHVEGEAEVVNKVGIIDLLFSQSAGISAQMYFLFIYLIIPVISCSLLIFSRFNKNFVLVSALLFLISAITSIVTKDVYATAIKYYVKATTGVKYSFYINESYFSYYLPIISNFVSFALAMIIGTNEVKFTIRDITEMGILVAMAFGLSFIKFLPMPTGGSVNLQMLPLFVLALRRGPIKGFIVGGFVYGLLTCLTDGYGFACYPFDYLVGFGSISILGLFSSLILDDTKGYTFKSELFLFIAGVLSTSMRFLGGTVSSMVVYGYNFVGAATYNAAYIFVSGGISLLAVMLLLGPIKRINQLFPVSPNSELQ